MKIGTKKSPIDTNIISDAQINAVEVLPSPTKQLHVLLVEDNAIALHFIETIVAQAGIKFTSATDGERALELAKTQQFDLIITDIGLPGICGYELAFAIRQWEKITHQKNVPIVGLTARTLVEEKAEGTKTGIDSMLSKPISLKVINELIAKFALLEAI
jgi:CheY-like chemotaxis protein